MIIKLFSGTELPPITKERWQKMKEAIDGGAEVLEFGDYWFKVSAISDVRQGGFDSLSYQVALKQDQLDGIPPPVEIKRKELE